MTDETRIPAPRRELESTIDPTANSKGRAGELFAHGLLLVEREAQREGAREQREQRIDRVMSQIRGAVDVEERRPVPFPFASLLKAASIAAVFLIIVLGSWMLAGRDSPEQILAIAHEAIDKTERGVHVYRATFQMDDRRGKQQIDRSWRVALAGKGRYHVKLVDERIDWVLASNGQTVWIVPPTGSPFEYKGWLPRSLRSGDMDPDLSYFSLRPMLRHILASTKLKHAGHEADAAGKVYSVLEGSYTTQSRSKRSWKRSRRSGSKKKTAPRPSRSYPGKLRLVIDDQTGQMHELMLTQSYGSRGASRFSLTRQRTPMDLAKAEISFDAPELRTPNWAKMSQWFGELFKGMAREAWKRRRARQDEKREDASSEKKR